MAITLNRYMKENHPDILDAWKRVSNLDIDNIPKIGRRIKIVKPCVYTYSGKEFIVFKVVMDDNDPVGHEQGLCVYPVGDRESELGIPFEDYFMYFEEALDDN